MRRANPEKSAPRSRSADVLAAVSRPASSCGPPVLLLHSWWGLTPSFLDFADRLAGAGFLAGCVDLYNGRIAADAEEARALRRAPRRVPMYRMLLAAGQALLADPAASGERLALVGFSMGGHWAIWLAQRPELPVDAVVLYYAARSVTRGVRAVPVLAHYAGTDDFVTASARGSMERSLGRAGWPYQAREYPGTGHWFAESAETAHDPAAADLAFGATVAFLRTRLPGWAAAGSADGQPTARP